MVDQANFDVIVIGAGPAGSTAAAVLARAQRSVCVVEQSVFPRFHIGESLIPGVLPYLEQSGAAPAVHAAGFVKKYAAEFITPDRAFRRRYVFAESLTPAADVAYEVERAEFDRILLDAARSAGASVIESRRVVDFCERDASIEIEMRDAAGAKQRLSSKYLIDSSGQQSFLAGHLGLRIMDRELRNIAVYAHYAGAWRASGPAAGDITVVVDADGWWWFIPLRNQTTSLGFVAPQLAFDGKPDAAWLEQRISRTEVLRERLHDARRLSEVRTVSDYSYRSKRFAGRRWLLAGDAAAFLDPVFSTGVYLGVSSGVEAACTVRDALESADPAAAISGRYEAWLSARLDTYSELVKGFYRPEFVDLFMHPTDENQMRQAVTSALAGYAEEPEVSVRVRSFLNAARANQRLELSPRLPGRREAAARLERERSRALGET